MEEKNKVCFRCGNFSGYYIKGESSFKRTKQGFCTEHQKIVENLANCECWRNSNRKIFSSKRTSLRVLSDLLINLSGIKQILQEAQEENNKI